LNSERTPFRSTPGRDVTRDRPAPFDIARFYYDQRERIAKDAPILRRLIDAVGSPGDLGDAQWAQWYSVVLGFAPDLIVELGRGRGNSTAVFAQAARQLGIGPSGKATKIVSLCVTGDWDADVAPAIAKIVDPDWFASVDARRIDILFVDYAQLLADHRRVLVLWDAHGFDIAELVLGEILPRLADREHLVLLHDISDNRYQAIPRSYGGQPLWKGAAWQKRTGAWESRINIGWMNSMQDQVIALADFAARNDLDIGSADHEYARFFEAHPDRGEEMRRLLGGDLFSVAANWAFFSLAGKQGPFHFPRVSGARAATHESRLVTDSLSRLPATVLTDAKAWAYASVLTWRPAEEPPVGAPSWVRCRVRVESGVAGISLLASDEKSFVESQVVSAAACPHDVMLRAPSRGERGRLVIHTWDAPMSARIRIDDLSLVW
jgi:hypothetical protein